MHDLPRPAPIRAGDRMSLEGENVSGQVFRTGRTARMHDYRAAAGALAASRSKTTAWAARTPVAGLLGLADRVAAFDGQFDVTSPRGGGTLVTATFPLPEP